MRRCFRSPSAGLSLLPASARAAAHAVRNIMRHAGGDMPHDSARAGGLAMFLHDVVWASVGHCAIDEREL